MVLNTKHLADVFAGKVNMALDLGSPDLMILVREWNDFGDVHITKLKIEKIPDVNVTILAGQDKPPGFADTGHPGIPYWLLGGPLSMV